MKNDIIISLFTSFIVLISLSFRHANSSPNRLQKNDTTYYHVYTTIERGVHEEFIKTYLRNGKLVADLLKFGYSEFSSVGVPTKRYYYGDSSAMEGLVLTQRRIDTLETFKKMILSNSIRHNQGLKTAGRYGAYSFIINNDTFKAESRELYSLTDALYFDRK